MRLTCQYRLSPQFMKLEHLLRVTVKCLLAGIFLPVVPAPDTTSAAISGDTAFCRHPRTGKKNDASIFVSEPHYLNLISAAIGERMLLRATYRSSRTVQYRWDSVSQKRCRQRQKIECSVLFPTRLPW